nr:unnamed protein product [Digitaria exilis]
MIPALLLLALHLCSDTAAQQVGVGSGPPASCATSCGNVSVPYPFGIDAAAGCHLPGFALTCDRTRSPPRLLLPGADGTFQVVGISLADATVSVLNTAGAVNLTYDGGVNGNGTWGGSGSGNSSSPYVVSERRNRLVVTGCNIQVTLVGDVASGNIITGCSSFCSITDSWTGAVLTTTGQEDSACSGIGCCETPIPIARPTYGVQYRNLDESHELDGEVPTAVRIAERGWFDGVVAARMLNKSLSDATARTAVPVVLEWAVASTPVVVPGVAPDSGNSSCPVDAAKSACRSSHSSCHNVTGNYRSGYVCRCWEGYAGNPYLAGGCQDIDECAMPGKCFGACVNTAGAGAGLLFLVLGVAFLTRKCKHRKARSLRQKFFKQNRGYLLQQLVSQKADIAERMIIPLAELEKATNNFDKAREIGGGGHGYLDPMYYYTGRLTEKSDVYSFGVVLIELITRKKPYSYRSPLEDSLVAYFTSLLSQGNLVPVLDPQVLEEGGEEVGAVAALAASCVVLKGEDRPTMRHVEMTLESIQAALQKDTLVSVSTKLSKDKQVVLSHTTGDGRRREESSRQYSLEEEFLLSARYPR